MPAEAAGPPTIEKPRTLREMLQHATKNYPSNRAIVSMYQDSARFPGKIDPDTEGGFLKWTYAQLDKKAEELAHSLSARGIRPGMRLAVFLLNSAEWALLFWTSVKLGTTFVPLDERAVPRRDEVYHYLDVTKPSALFVSSAASAHLLVEKNTSCIEAIAFKAITEPTELHIDGWDNLERILAEENNLTGEQPSHHDLPNGHIAGSSSSSHLAPDSFDNTVNNHTPGDLDLVTHILFTSGSSGLPKACPVTNRNNCAAIIAGDKCNPKDRTDLVLAVAPPSHSMGMCNMIHTWINGATVVIPTPAFEAKAALDAIYSMKCTHMSAIPTMLLALLKQPTFHPQKTQSLRAVLLGGTVVSPDIAAATTDPKLIGAAEALVGFGMTEGLPICGSSSKQGLKLDRGAVSMGQPLPGVKVRICERQHRRVIARGETGEVHFGGDMVIGGYLNGDNQCFYDDQSGHWIESGDEAMMDEQGNIFIFGRYKDIIIRGGENLSPALIENCLGRAGVLGQVIGVPDDIAGEVPLAVVHIAENAQIPRAKVHDVIMDSLGHSCLPASYVTLTELGLTSFPLTTSGKVVKPELKRIVLEYLAQFAPKEPSTIINGVGTDTISITETLLTNILANLIGQSEQSVSRDQPLSTMLDSINILRFQASIQKATTKKASMDAFFGDATISTLAKQLDAMSTTDLPILRSERRQEPPTTETMVHTHGDASCASRTRAQAELLLAKYGMSWDDVEDVFPIPDLSSRGFEAMRPMAFSIRLTFAVRSITQSQLRVALEKTLEKWSMLRSLAMKFDNTSLFVIAKACKAISEASIVELPGVESQENLCKLRFPEHWGNNVHLGTGCPLARFAIASVKGTDSTGLQVLAHHSTYDAISFQAFRRDLEANIQNVPFSEPYTDYKLFADAFYQYTISIPAQLSVAYHVDRLRGIGSLREILWPPQRCSGWFIGDDSGYTIASALQNPLHQPRSQIDNDGGYAGMVGIRRITPLSDITALCSKYNISAPVLFKAACAILNAHLWGSSEVCFANSQAGRAWPFLDPSITNYLPNPISIAGNTLGLVTNRIQIHHSATVGSLLSQLEEEQYHLTIHAHAPYTAISSQLNPADAAVYNGARRQLLNWNPTVGDVASQNVKKKMEVLQVEGFTEVMLEWHCGMVGNSAYLVARWDGAQFGKSTVEGWVGGFVNALKWISEIENWERRIGEVEIGNLDKGSCGEIDREISI
ncbi:MAG: hypothetical protein Q9166_000617 [cf. Caloplaca sp. 2 TL-2023]